MVDVRRHHKVRAPGKEFGPTQVELGQGLPTRSDPVLPELLVEVGRMEVVKILGQTAATLVDQQRPPDRYTDTCKSRGAQTPLEAGIYFYRPTAGASGVTQKKALM